MGESRTRAVVVLSSLLRHAFGGVLGGKETQGWRDYIRPLLVGKCPTRRAAAARSIIGRTSRSHVPVELNQLPSTPWRIKPPFAGAPPAIDRSFAADRCTRPWLRVEFI